MPVRLITCSHMISEGFYIPMACDVAQSEFYSIASTAMGVGLRVRLVMIRAD